jgi:hypothetical protein
MPLREKNFQLVTQKLQNKIENSTKAKGIKTLKNKNKSD